MFPAAAWARQVPVAWSTAAPRQLRCLGDRLELTGRCRTAARLSRVRCRQARWVRAGRTSYDATSRVDGHSTKHDVRGTPHSVRSTRYAVPGCEGDCFERDLNFARRQCTLLSRVWGLSSIYSVLGSEDGEPRMNSAPCAEGHPDRPGAAVQESVARTFAKTRAADASVSAVAAEPHSASS